jgi:serine/threonine protein kinase
MNGVVQCPNPICGHPSLVSMDSLGRVFRCPRCQSKLKGGAVLRADSKGFLPGPKCPSASSRDSARSGACSHPSRAWYPAWSGPVDRHGIGFGRDTRRIAATTSTVPASVRSIEPVNEDDLEEWLDPLSDDATSVGDGESTSSSRLDREFPPGSSDEIRLGRYQVLGILGEGRYARVYRGFDPILERAVALKVPRPGMRSLDEVKERFLGEARALARLRHPAIVPVYELGSAADRCFIAMALIEGHSLAEHRHRNPRSIDCRRAAEIVADLAEALDHAHGQGILHRDIKPANILFDESGSVYLTDFGLAYRPDSGELPARPGTLIGTPAYAAPEHASGDPLHALPAGDQYSLGAVFYEMLCGRTPFSGPPLYVLYQAMNQDPPSPRSVAPAVPASLADICLKMLARSPETRFASCADVAETLRGCMTPS